VFAVAEITVPFPLIAAGEQRVSSSLAAIIIATAPLFVAVLALRFDATERVTGRRLIGLLIGLGGVVALVGIDVAGRPGELLGAGLVLVGTVGYAAAPLIVRSRLGDTDPRATIAASLVLATILLAPAALIAPPKAIPSATALSSIAVLGLACTALALVLFVSLVSEVGAGKAAIITYVSPIVAVALGVTVLGERPGAGAVAGLLLILAGSWLATGGRVPPGLGAVRTPRLGRARRVSRDQRGSAQTSGKPVSPPA
jgi:drug/metabolite transporter (DMT)-like permease